jgi:hypothetical protein
VEKAVLFVFDWEWNYIAHEVLPLSPWQLSMLRTETIASLSRYLAKKHIPPHIKDVHIPVAVIDGDCEITPEIIEEAKKAKDANVSRSETWETPESSFTEVFPPKENHS